MPGMGAIGASLGSSLAATLSRCSVSNAPGTSRAWVLALLEAVIRKLACVKRRELEMLVGSILGIFFMPGMSMVTAFDKSWRRETRRDWIAAGLKATDGRTEATDKERGMLTDTGPTSNGSHSSYNVM